MRINPKAALVACALMSLAAMTACGGAANNTSNTANTAGSAASTQAPPDKTFTGPVVAKYNGGDVRKDELDQAYDLLVVLPGYEQQEPKDKFLTYYTVWYKYVYGKASADKSVKIDVSKAKQMADQSIQQLVGQKYKTKDDVLAAMKKMGVSEDDLVRLGIKGQYISTYVQNQTKVSDAEAKDYYNKNQDQFLMVTVDQVLVKTLPEAQKIEAQLKAGADFKTIADKYSIDPGVKQNHGTYANQPVGGFVPEFGQACATMPLGQISDPIQTQFGYHVIRVDKRSVQPFDQVKDQVTQQAQSDKEQNLYNTAEKSAGIKVLVKAADL